MYNVYILLNIIRSSNANILWQPGNMFDRGTCFSIIIILFVTKKILLKKNFFKPKLLQLFQKKYSTKKYFDIVASSKSYTYLISLILKCMNFTFGSIFLSTIYG